MKILIIDNFDSFTYNLVHYLEEMDCTVHVVRNNEVELDSLFSFDAIVLSPGPGLPNDAGMLMQVIERCYLTKPILGVCLGMQALAEFTGAKLFNQLEVKHGVAEMCRQIKPNNLFEGITDEFQVGLYHSWGVDLKNIEVFKESAISENGVLMAIEHVELPLVGVQFHPESILTPDGKKILSNFITKFC